MMGLEVVCCGKCFSYLQDAHPAIADAWADICAEYVIQGLKPIKWGFECDAINFLETHLFLVSQEPAKGKRKLTIRPRGHHEIQGQHFFCILFDQHLENG